MADLNNWLPWINLFLILIIIGLVIAIYVIYYNKVQELERDGLSFNIINGTTSASTDSFTSGSYTLYLANSPNVVITVNANSNIQKGQQFNISNLTNSNVSYIKGTNVNIIGNTTILPNTMAIFVATDNNNNYTRIQ